MAEKHEIVVIKADVQPVRGREVFWLLSKKQVEHIVQDIAVWPIPFAQKYLAGLAVWQGISLPVVDLETYFNFKPLRVGEVKRRVVVRTTGPDEDKRVTRLLLNIPHELRIKPVDDTFIPARIPREELVTRGLLGVYEWEKDKLMLVPDLSEIAAGGRKTR